METVETKSNIVILKEKSALAVKRLSAALVLLADGIEEVSEMGDRDLEGKATLGFANIIRMCGEELHGLIVTDEAEIDRILLKQAEREHRRTDPHGGKRIAERKTAK